MIMTTDNDNDDDDDDDDPPGEPVSQCQTVQGSTVPAVDHELGRSGGQRLRPAEVDVVGGGSAEVDAVLVLPHHVQQLPEPQDPHAVGVATVDGGGEVAESDEAEAGHVGVVASLAVRVFIVSRIKILGFPLTSWGTDLEAYLSNPSP